MTQLSIAENAPLDLNPDLAQWFTPDWLADHVAELIPFERLMWHRHRVLPYRVLEPAAGDGALIRAMLRVRSQPHRHGMTIDAVDVDGRFARPLSDVAAEARKIRAEMRVEIGSYLDRPAPAERYDIAITNPPFTRGMETPFLAKLLDECEQIIAILPSRALHGLARHNAIWRRFEPVGSADREWSIRSINYCKRRPKFAGANGGKDEIVIVDLQRVPGDCKVRWI